MKFASPLTLWRFLVVTSFRTFLSSNKLCFTGDMRILCNAAILVSLKNILINSRIYILFSLTHTSFPLEKEQKLTYKWKLASISSYGRYHFHNYGVRDSLPPNSTFYISYLLISFHLIKRVFHLLFYYKQLQKGGDLTKSYDKSPYTNRNVKRAKWQHKQRHKNFD